MPELQKNDFDLIDLAKPFSDLVGRPEPHATYLVWGPKGGGKSTFAMGFARVLAPIAKADGGAVLYVSAEEGPYYTIQSRSERLGALDANLLVSDFRTVDELKKAIERHRVRFVFIDSASVIDPASMEMVEFARWCHHRGIGLVIIAHAQKGGKEYKGNSMLGHEVYVEIHCFEEEGEHYAETIKNRYAELARIETPMSADEIGKTPAPAASKSKRHRARPRPRARSRSAKYQSNALPRWNPVATPFKITLAELAKRRKSALSGVAYLNSLVGWKYGCAVAKHSGESNKASLSFRSKRLARTQGRPRPQVVVELLIDGRVEDEVYADTTKAALRAVVERHADLVVEIHRQDHALKVLGKREYRRQEKQGAAAATDVSASTEAPGRPQTRRAAPTKKTRPATTTRGSGRAAASKAAKAKPKKPAKAKPKKPAPGAVDVDAFNVAADNLETIMREALKQ